MAKFRKSPAHTPQADRFIGTTGRLEMMATRISPDHLEKLRALAYYDRDKSQRQIIEAALEIYFEQHQDQLNAALAMYKQRG